MESRVCPSSRLPVARGISTLPAAVGTAMPGCGHHVAHRRPRLLRPAVAQDSYDSAHRLLARLFDES